MKSFTGKVAAITGAGSGIGRQLAIELAQRGGHLALSDVNPTSLAETAASCEAFHVHVTVASVDVANRADVYRWAETVAKDHGKVNLIFNNAGVGLASTLEEVSYEDFEWLMGINFWGVVYGTKAFLPHLRASGAGHVVNISSVFGIQAAPANGSYSAAKFAVRGFTEALRQELELMNAPVSATCVHPGGIKTNIARDARYSSNIAALGLDPQASRRAFEAAFITSPQTAARSILRGVQRNQRRVLVGLDAYAIDLWARLAPAGSQRLMMALARSMAQ
ncbi:MAG: SDR family NAD(P)-dependent oxidoreductase [Deltaproteobacteria bacterium]